MYQTIDEDHSGKVSRTEMLRLLKTLNLQETGIRPKVINKICEIVDTDGDGVEFDEFCRLMTSADVKPLLMGAL